MFVAAVVSGTSVVAVTLELANGMGIPFACMRRLVAIGDVLVIIPGSSSPDAGSCTCRMFVALGNITSSVMSNDPSGRATTFIRIPGLVAPGPGVVDGAWPGCVAWVVGLPAGPGLGATGPATSGEQAAAALSPRVSAAVASHRIPDARRRPRSSTPDSSIGRNSWLAAGALSGEPRSDMSHRPPTDPAAPLAVGSDLRIRYAAISGVRQLLPIFHGDSEGGTKW